MKAITSSIRAKMLLFIGLSLVIALLILGGVTIYQLNTLQTKNSQNLNDELINAEKRGLQNTTHAMSQILSQFVAENREHSLSEEEVLQELAQHNRDIHFGEAGYFFIYDTSGNTISYPVDASLEGTNRWDLQDSSGKYIMQEMAELAQSGGGFMEYIYQNPTTNETETKVSYTEMIDGTGYFIGAGMYASTAKAAVDAASKHVTAVKNQTLWILVISFIVGLIFINGVVYVLSVQITRPLKNLTHVMAQAKDGDLSARAEAAQSEGGDEMQQIGVSFNEMITGFSKMIAQIGEMSQQLAASSEELYASGEQVGEIAGRVGIAVENVASGAEEQSAQVEEVSQNAVTLTDRINGVGKRSATMIDSAKAVMNSIQKGNTAVDQSIDQIHQIERQTTEVAEVIKVLGTRSEQVGSIVELINGIASQTNLLALNAAIEAARAGEAGRGFSVVADQIRKLAEESANATDKITYLIKEIQNDIQQSVTKMESSRTSVQSGVEAMNQTDHIFHQIMDVSTHLKELLQSVATDTQEMASYSQDVRRAIHDIAQVSQEFAQISQDVASSNQEQLASTQEIIHSSKQISDMAGELAEAIERFKL